MKIAAAVMRRGKLRSSPRLKRSARTLLIAGAMVLGLGAATVGAQQSGSAAWEGNWKGSWGGTVNWTMTIKDVASDGTATVVDEYGDHRAQIDGAVLKVHRQYIDDEFHLNSDGTLSGTRDSRSRGGYDKGSVFTITMTKSPG